MQVTTSVREDGKTQLTVELTADEVKKHIDATFKDLRKSRIPGFRPGKAPRKVIEQNFGGHDVIYAQITSDMVGDVAPLAADQEDLIFITSPEFDDESVGMVADGEPFTFSMFGDVKPTIELSSYDAVAIEMPPEEVTDGDIAQQLEQIQQYYFSFDDVSDREASKGDFVTVELDATVDGEPVEGLNSASRMFEVGGTMLPELFNEQVTGMKIGDTKEFEFDPTGVEEYEFLDGKKVACKMTVKELRSRHVPELDDAFAEQVGFDTLDALKDALREQIAQQKGEQLPALKERRCVDALVERFDGEIDEAYVSYQRQDILKDFFNSLQDRGLTFDQFLSQNNVTADDFQKDLDEQAQENAVQALALDALFNELGLEITEEDIAAEFAVADDPEAVRKSWEEAGRMTIIREAIRRSKACQWLVDNAEVTIVDEAAAADEA